MNRKYAGFLLRPALVVVGVAQGFFLSAIPVCLILMFYPINTGAASGFVYLMMTWRGLAALHKLDALKEAIAAKEAEAVLTTLRAGS